LRQVRGPGQQPRASARDYPAFQAIDQEPHERTARLGAEITVRDQAGPGIFVLVAGKVSFEQFIIERSNAFRIGVDEDAAMPVQDLVPHDVGLPAQLGHRLNLRNIFELKRPVLVPELVPVPGILFPPGSHPTLGAGMRADPDLMDNFRDHLSTLTRCEIGDQCDVGDREPSAAMKSRSESCSSIGSMQPEGVSKLAATSRVFDTNHTTARASPRPGGDQLESIELVVRVASCAG